MSSAPPLPPAPAALPRHGDRRRLRVGLLGGSFNPAHDGHMHIALLALRRLRLDQVWLLVSPGNPLKPTSGMAGHAQRLKCARALAAGHRQIIATDIERHLNTRYTLDTVRALRRRFPRVRFVWLMGADNLAQLPRWRGWMALARIVPFAVLPRPTYTRRAVAGRAASRLRVFRHAAREAPLLASLAPPAWLVLGGRQSPLSATALRRTATGEDLSPGSPRPPPPPAPRIPSAARR